MKVKSECEVAQSCPTLSDPMDCIPPGSSGHGVFQAGVLEWGAIAFPDNNCGANLKLTVVGQGVQAREKGGYFMEGHREGPFDKMLPEHSPKPSEGEPGGCGEAGRGDGRCKGPGVGTALMN